MRLSHSPPDPSPPPHSPRPLDPWTPGCSGLCEPRPTKHPQASTVVVESASAVGERDTCIYISVNIYRQTRTGRRHPESMWRGDWSVEADVDGVGGGGDAMCWRTNDAYGLDLWEICSGMASANIFTAPSEFYSACNAHAPGVSGRSHPTPPAAFGAAARLGRRRRRYTRHCQSS